MFSDSVCFLDVAVTEGHVLWLRASHIIYCMSFHELFLTIFIIKIQFTEINFTGVYKDGCL